MARNTGGSSSRLTIELRRLSATCRRDGWTLERASTAGAGTRQDDTDLSRSRLLLSLPWLAPVLSHLGLLIVHQRCTHAKLAGALSLSDLRPEQPHARRLTPAGPGSPGRPTVADLHNGAFYAALSLDPCAFSPHGRQQLFRRRGAARPSQ